ncbi:hypothetical protein TW82_18540 [Pseudoalteromonas fuliginea]|nr:hypothetical protein TW82_18540 [Pseudoalteromonas fuliginea]
MRDSNHIKNEAIEKILFGSFSNENRINFLLAMAKSDEMYLYYKDMKKVHMAPDEDVEGIIPDEIALFEKKINDLMFKGKSLDSSIYLKNKT